MSCNRPFLLLLFFLASPQAWSACPSSPKEWQKKAPAFLISVATKQPNLELQDFSARLGKGASGWARPYGKGRKERYALVEAEDPASALTLSGVMKCDPKTGKSVLLSLSWVKGRKSGLVRGPLEE